ncbi:hypothetical protein [Sandarakinorhabdus sp.]|uniref:hypothetical protein n=1 Tax=Sandarakinorhabdus sp. TaxID=1916663 RepID=UPI00286D937E|nr:hypothetical protein [Sandarakinorhabdus sp.]
MNLFVLTALAVMCAAPALASPETEVLAATDAVMAAINTRDAAAFDRIAGPDLVIQTIRFAADGSSQMRSVSRAQILESFAKTPAPFDERLLGRNISITRDFAHVWAPYTLDIGGKRIHCGVDSFGFMKVAGTWRLTSLAWTADPQGCTL